MKMNEIKYMIQNAFDRVYGFSPARNKIVPLESSGCGNTIEWLAFAVGGIGYEYNAKTDELLKSESYNTRGWEK